MKRIVWRLYKKVQASTAHFVHSGIWEKCAWWWSWRGRGHGGFWCWKEVPDAAHVLQNAHCLWHKHAWRVLCSSPSCWGLFPTAGDISFIALFGSWNCSLPCASVLNAFGCCVLGRTIINSGLLKSLLPRICMEPSGSFVIFIGVRSVLHFTRQEMNNALFTICVYNVSCEIFVSHFYMELMSVAST